MASEMGKVERKTKPQYGIVNFERRKHPRFSLDWPIEYWPINKDKRHPCRTIDISEGGLLLHLSEQLEVGQNLRLNFFIDSTPELHAIEAFGPLQVEVVWRDIHLGKNGDYRIGVKFVEISPEDMHKLKSFIKTLGGVIIPSE
jgi:c-di-GMP-binding flagellar brake protein YcgR